MTMFCQYAKSTGCRQYALHFYRLCSMYSKPYSVVQTDKLLRRADRRSNDRQKHRAACSAAAATEAPLAQSMPSAQERQLYLYNTLSRKKEAFTSRTADRKVAMYVCGVTVYDFSHIGAAREGHARVYTSFDILYRYLRHLGFQVQYVRNFTDIDDKIIRRANELKESYLELSQRFIAEFHADMDALNCLPPSLEPRATDHVEDMVATIQRIVDNGHAYESGGDVFFEVASIPGYGRLSGRNQDDNRAGERVAVDARKRGAADFVLWKAAKAGEPSWHSPWGLGRPGWHLECSAMIRTLLGPVIDIHGGGRDLVFPHHENEIAQSQAAACCSDRESMPGGIDFVRFWLHNGFVNVDSEKMSKSLGNFFTIRDVTRRYHPLALRFFLISSQYRQPINYTQRSLESAADRMYYIYQTLADVELALDRANVDEVESARSRAAAAVTSGASSEPGLEELVELLKTVHEGLADDLNTPIAIAALSEPLSTLNDLLTSKKGKKAPGRVARLAALQAGVTEVMRLLGLQSDNVPATLSEMRALALLRAGLDEGKVEAAIAQRASARQSKDYAAADAVREAMQARGVQIMDTPEGTIWRPAARLDAADDP